MSKSNEYSSQLEMMFEVGKEVVQFSEHETQFLLRS